MDITTRDGNKTRLAGKVSASTFAAKAMLEGPLKKQTTPGAGSSSFLINYRRSYLEQTQQGTLLVCGYGGATLQLHRPVHQAQLQRCQRKQSESVRVQLHRRRQIPGR